jgi:glycosyltransferase involved in cell wall biosynthesis
VFHFAGFCRDVSAYLAAADIFVHTPVWEGLGVAVIEALAAGLPVVASRAGGIPEIITDRETGLLIPTQDSSALCNALLQCLRHPDWAKTLGAHGQSKVRTHFDIETTARANEALYYELLAVRRERQRGSP